MDKKIITIKQCRGVRTGGMGCWQYTYFIDFGYDWSYTVQASEEGLGHMISVFREAGREVVTNLGYE